MATDTEFEKLEELERKLTLEELSVMLQLLSNTKVNIKKEVIAFYNEYGQDGIITYAEAQKWVGKSDHRRRIVALLVFLCNEFRKLEKPLEVKFQDLETKIFKMEFDFFSLDTPEGFTRLIWGLDALTWKDRLHNNIEKWWKTIGLDIKHAIMRGDNLEKVLTQLDKRFNSIEKALNKLGLNESGANSMLAKQKIFDLLGIKSYRYYTIPDERRCEQCGELHGRVFPMTAYEVGLTAPPIHPRCRCITIPILE